MKASSILRRAAAIAERDVEGACYGIAEAFGWQRYEEAKERAQQRFRELFKPETCPNAPIYWLFGRPWAGRERDVPAAENQNHRILAMLLTADILESEGD